jgi:hypothetical protein
MREGEAPTNRCNPVLSFMTLQRWCHTGINFLTTTILSLKVDRLRNQLCKSLCLLLQSVFLAINLIDAESSFVQHFHLELLISGINSLTVLSRGGNDEGQIYCACFSHRYSQPFWR